MQGLGERATVSMDDELVAYIPILRERLRSIGVTFEANNVVNAAAVGITQLVWRNGPIEKVHGGARGRRNGLHDGVMFARNTWVYHQALQAVTSNDPYAFTGSKNASWTVTWSGRAHRARYHSSDMEH
jgi:hypothetical protein